jgi:5-formyltetrahydrofolate cyclo-ligase
MADGANDLQRVKRAVRAQANAGRQRQENKDQLSRQICRKLAALPEYAAAQTVMLYVDFGPEVRTRHFLEVAGQDGKRLVVPYCVGDDLGLFLLESIDELTPGTWGILEPKAELRGLADRTVDPGELDLIVVPGVAFDRRGGRVGHGKGYYDRLLRRVRAGAALVALAFESQLVDEVPMQPHDVFMDKIVTEAAVYTRDKAKSAPRLPSESC